MRGSSGRAILAATVIAATLVAAPAAQAALRYAAPGGTGPPTTCPAINPCNLQDAVEDDSVADGDEVVVLPGTYVEGPDEIKILDAINLHGAIGSMPLITSSASEAIEATLPGIRVADLAIDYSGVSNAIRLTNGASGERLYVKSAGTVGCSMFQGTLRDSVCWSMAASGDGLFSSVSALISITTVLRNVTAVGSGTNADGIDFTSAGGLSHVVDAKNVIASGTGFDVNATAGAASTMTFNFENSNYDTENESGAGATVTDPGSGTNQTAPPSFVTAAAGDFHQAAGSPTIDAGTTDAIGSLDIDGEPRNQGAAPDIGADEFTVPTAAPPPGDNFPPDTGIHSGPKKKTFKRHIKFEFGGSEPGVTFECQLDDNGWEPCTSPKKYKRLKRGKHVFAVRAIDQAGNADPTPADRHWKVTRKPKHSD